MEAKARKGKAHRFVSLCYQIAPLTRQKLIMAPRKVNISMWYRAHATQICLSTCLFWVSIPMPSRIDQKRFSM